MNSKVWYVVFGWIVSAHAADATCAGGFSNRPNGEVAEWSKAPVSKTGRLETVSRVRISPSPKMKKSLATLKRDERFARLIKKHGAPALSRGDVSGNGMFRALVRSIIYQQLSGKAASSIHSRFLALFPRKRPTPRQVLGMSESGLRACGLSLQKIGYMKDLAQKFESRAIKHRSFAKMQS